MYFPVCGMEGYRNFIMYRVQLQNFEGPLDLLLYFIRRDEIDIMDIPISKITEEYMATLDMMQHFNITVAGEFIDMAATLMRIKAKMLLPRPRMDDLDDMEDPRAELVQKLLDYQRFKEAARQLERLSSERGQYFPRGSKMELPEGQEEPGVYLREVSLYDIARYFKAAMDRMPVIQPYELQREPISLEMQKALILSSFNPHGKLRFSALIDKLNSKLEIVVAFLAILEMIRAGEITVIQKKLFGELEIRQLSRVA